ncbi:ATP-binding cassette domain-containing protein [Pseudodesulfovibrio sp. JC047]|uniref:ABC transporter ATP-binding protein n=1 Tax=Pseudodesulfovibrio sp. JC047 TaxID=2683199 RepID=UPI0013D2EBCC|nr:ABC transporter ATP-binding protein [Pseudodesulfovibrio sp. JC047]NDV18498.1 ATP-binding cassette domain-containing protein [Pseudodesulfovibrio sp. JC047]
MIDIRNLSIQFPGFAISDVSLHVHPGEFFTLIGPTGSGKTLVLESLAGLAPKGTGELIVHGRDIANLPPEKRTVSLVYQDHSLFPHLNVLENVTYGQRYHGIDATTGKKEALALLDRLGLSRVVNRKPDKLSGGEKQRVSIARALACHPSVLLLDEPMSSLDPQFRAEFRHTLKELHHDTGLTILMVTHDFVDALTLADRAAVIRNGRLEQTGDVTDIFRQPASPFVAEFVGMANVLPASFKNGHCSFAGHTVTVDTPPQWNEGYVAFRPEDILVSMNRRFPDEWCTFEGNLTRIDRIGFHWTAQIACNDQTVTATVDQLTALEYSQQEKTVHLGIAKSHLHFMPPQTPTP